MDPLENDRNGVLIKLFAFGSPRKHSNTTLFKQEFHKRMHVAIDVL